MTKADLRHRGKEVLTANARHSEDVTHMTIDSFCISPSTAQRNQGWLLAAYRKHSYSELLLVVSDVSASYVH